MMNLAYSPRVWGVVVLGGVALSACNGGELGATDGAAGTSNAGGGGTDNTAGASGTAGAPGGMAGSGGDGRDGSAGSGGDGGGGTSGSGGTAGGGTAGSADGASGTSGGAGNAGDAGQGGAGNGGAAGSGGATAGNAGAAGVAGGAGTAGGNAGAAGVAGGSSEGAAGTGGTTAGNAGTGGGGNAGASGTAGASGAAGSQGNSGMISVYSAPSFYDIFASFTRAAPRGNDGSTTTVIGPCVVTSIDSASGSGGRGGSGGRSGQSSPSAGVITVAGGLFGPVLLTPDATGLYQDTSDQKTLFDGGEILLISAAGAEVPAFSTPLATPNFVTLTAPMLPPPPTNLVVDATQDLAFTWSEGKAGQSVQLGALGINNTMSVDAQCMFDAAAGQGSIPSSVLQLVAATVTADSLSLIGADVLLPATTTTAGDYAISLQASNSGRTPDGSAFTSLVTFQ